MLYVSLWLHLRYYSIVNATAILNSKTGWISWFHNVLQKCYILYNYHEKEAFFSHHKK